MNANQTHLPQIFLVLLLLSSHILFAFIAQRKKDKKRCSGYLDSTLGQCTKDGKHYLSFIKRDESECDPDIYNLKRRDIVLFAGKLALQYLTDERKTPPSAMHDLLVDHATAEDIIVYQGIFYFLLKPFLTVLPTDFGQNYITPYGTPSFLADYVSCIPDLSSVCDDLIKDPDRRGICLKYFEQLKRSFSNRDSQNCTINDKGLYDNPLYVELGLLGAMTISPTQAIVLSGTIPANVGLKYWSFTPYLADRYDEDDICTPYHNIYFSSLTDPFNNFTSHTEQDFRFAIIITINKVVGDAMNHALRKDLLEKGELDYIHRFDLPSGPGTMIVQPGLLNPNGLTNEDAAFNYMTDRLAVLFRMNVRNSASKSFEAFKLNPGFESYCVDLKTTEKNEFYSGIVPPLKVPLPLQTDESLLRDKFNSIQKLLDTSFRDTFSSRPIHRFDSLLGTFAPLDSGVYNNKFTYESGRQAIQMASNANGDNPDTWYKVSQPECMSMDDILVCVCVNHTKLRNSIYCNINVLDKQMGRGIGSVEIFEDDTELLNYPFYSVMISRNKELLENFKDSFSSLFEKDIYIYDYLINTGDTMHWSVPMCHQLLFIERAYLNPTVAVVGDDGTVSFPYYKNKDVDEKYWKQMTRPDGNQLLHPVFMKFTKKSGFSVWSIAIVIIILLFILWILLFRAVGM